MLIIFSFRVVLFRQALAFHVLQAHTLALVPTELATHIYAQPALSIMMKTPRHLALAVQLEATAPPGARLPVREI